jgi:hypothetical protein
MADFELTQQEVREGNGSAAEAVYAEAVYYNSGRTLLSFLSSSLR